MGSPSSYVTQAQVATRAQVHQTTVSLVFRNHPSVPLPTRERVWKAARELGYKRHPLLAALMSTRLHLSTGAGNPILAFLTDFEKRHRWQESPAAAEIFSGARASAEALGYGIEVFWLRDPEVRPSRLVEILKARNIHGVLLAPTHEPHGFFAFDFRPFAVIALGGSSKASPLFSVSHDHFNGMLTALQHCVAAGRRRIAVALTIEAHEDVRSRWLSAHAFACDQHVGMARLPVWQGSFDGRHLKTWLKKNRPDAIVGTFDDRLNGWLGEHGYKVPDDLALVSLSLGAEDRFHAGIYQRWETIGVRAVDMLVTALNHNESGLAPMRQVLQIEGEWRDGPSMPSEAKASGLRAASGRRSAIATA